MNKKISIFESNQEHKNPLITTGLSLLIALVVLDFLHILFVKYIAGWNQGPIYISFSPYIFYTLVCGIVILGSVCNQNKKLFNIFRCTFFIPFLLVLCGWLKYDFFTMIAKQAAHEATYSEPLYGVIFSYGYFFLFYLTISTLILARGLFKHHRYKGEGYLSMPLNIILLLIFPVFWKMCWVFRTTRVLNKISNEPKRNAFAQTLLCYIVPFYALYWTYSTARRSDVVAVSKGLPSNTAVLCLILQLFIPFIPPIIIQDKINQVVSDDGTMFKALQEMNAKSAERKIQQERVQAPQPTSADELKKYKDLLDCGAITQEEYDKKKAELLNL